MHLNRRNFLKTVSVGLVSSLVSCSHKKLFNPDEDILLSGGQFIDNKKTQNCLVIINLIQQEKRIINTPFIPHGINVDPNNKYRVLCFEKDGNSACEVDLQTQSITRTLHSEDKHLFSGHASFSEDGKIIYCIEKNMETHQGIITIRNTDTLETTNQLPTLGLAPHDCQLTKNDHLIISNTGQSESGFHKPSLVVIDLTTEKLVERIKLDNENLNCGHFKATNEDDLIIASAPLNTENTLSPGGISFRLSGEPVITMIEPDLVIKRMTGEALSIEVNSQKSIVAISHPKANLLTFWSMKDKKIIKAFGFENPRGLSQTLDKKYFIISYGKKAAMAKISVDNLMPQTDSIVQPTLAAGEHLLNWSNTLRQIMPKRVYD